MSDHIWRIARGITVVQTRTTFECSRILRGEKRCPLRLSPSRVSATIGNSSRRGNGDVLAFMGDNLGMCTYSDDPPVFAVQPIDRPRCG